ncbi:MAG: ATP-binding protein [Deltaproteobacteria bacterium]|nr:ATP-binding protein [Deltaproteobacteria bacterium]
MNAEVINKIMAETKANREAIIMARNEVAGNCEQHGQFTYRELEEVGDVHFQYGQKIGNERCPKCYLLRQEKREAEFWKEKFIKYSGIPKRFIVNSFENYSAAQGTRAFLAKKTAEDYAKNFVQHLPLGRSIVMTGKTGTGKTHLACAIIKELMLNQRFQCKYTKAYHIIREIKDTYRQHDSTSKTEIEIINELLYPDLLVIDEVGMQFGTDTEKLLLFEVLDGRYENMKPSVIVSNLDIPGITEYLGDRIIDRLCEDGAILTFEWASHRQL